jgi:hypothetical protein
MNHALRKNASRLLLLAAFTCGGLCPALATDAAAPPSANPSIDGFRNAKFGMTESQVKSAIEAEFKTPASAITEAENQLQHTEVLSVLLPNLVPDGGSAAVSYVFGYQSHKLIQVNILWSPEIDPKITAAMLNQNGGALQQYFAGEGFSPDHSAGNVAIPGGEILFRGTDATGNAVALILSGSATKDQKTGKTVVSLTGLTLTYAANALHPDVFQLAKGSF